MQLTGCKTGQLSFHLKKLDYLVEQDELKRYRLSEKGKEDVEMILPMLGNGEKEKKAVPGTISPERKMEFNWDAPLNSSGTHLVYLFSVPWLL